MSLIPAPGSAIVARIRKRIAIPADYRAVWRLRTLRLLATSRFCSNMIFYSAVIVAFERSRGLSFTQMFLLESILSAVSWLLDIPTGVWADLIGYQRLLLLARALELASLVITIFAYGFWAFAFGSLFFGAYLACSSGCEDALVYASLPIADSGNTQADESSTSANERLGTTAFALLSAANSAGFFVGLTVGSFIGAISPTLAVICTLIPLSLALIATFQLRSIASAAGAERPIPSPHTPREAEGAPTSQPTARITAPPPDAGARPDGAHAITTERLSARELLATSWRLARTQPALVGLSLAQSAAFVLVNAIFWYNQPFFARTGIAVLWFGPLTALAVGAAALGPLALPLAIRRMGRRWTLAVALLAPGLAYLGLGLLAGRPSGHAALAVWLAPTLAVGLVALVVGGSAWRDPLLRDELARRAPTRGRAAALSAFSFLGTFAGIALNPLIGRVGDVGLSAVGLSLGAGLLALGLVTPWLIAPSRAAR